MIDFDPNKPHVSKEYLWATYVVYRRPAFKAHHARGHALSAIISHPNKESILYRWEIDKWIEIIKHEKPFDNRCYMHDLGCLNIGRLCWINKKSNIPDLVYVCWEHRSD